MRSFHDRIKEKYEMLKGVTYKDVRFLKKELRSMQAFLNMAGGMRHGDLDRNDKFFADQLREIAYHTEDVLETIMVCTDGIENKHCFKGLTKNITNLFIKEKTPYQIAAATKEIKILVQRTLERRQKYFVRSPRLPAPNTKIRKYRALLHKFTDIVGIDRAMDDLTKSLGMNERDGVSKQLLKIVSLYGIGGVGKTTLAGQIFQKLKPQFNFSAFVSLPPNPDMGVVSRDILDELHGGYYDDRSMDQTKVINVLHEFLQNKRYFIVIDDISEKESWLTIKHALVDNNLGSIIITTTRNYDIAKVAGGAYELKPLSAHDSKTLFYRSVYGEKCPGNEFGEVSSDDEFTEVSNKVLAKCGGLPLAITSIARMLVPELTEEKWDEVCKTIEAGEDGDYECASIRSVLSGYYSLPSNLRSCLLYISIFPRKYNIRRDRLVWRWIGEGFVQEQEGTSLFELGQRYFDQLLNTGLIQEVYFNDGDGTVKYCRVHDVIFWQICSLAIEENFVTIFHGTQHTHPRRNVRRLSIQCSELEHTFLQNAMSVSQVRSVTVFGPGINFMPPFSSFGVLRVVDLEGCDFKGSRELKHLGKMLHLRYLGLRGTHISKLPRAIGDLRLLQMLDLFGTKLENLPSSVTLLKKLICLYVERETRLPDGMGNLASLEELSKVSISIDSVKWLRNLTEMKVLGIVWKKIEETLEKDLMVTLGCLRKMRTLEIYALSGSSELELRRFVTFIEGNLPQVTINMCSANASACDVEVATNIHPILCTANMSNMTDLIQSYDGAEKISTVAQEIQEIEE